MLKRFSPVYLFTLASLYFFSALNGSRLLTERDLAVFFIPPRILWTKLLAIGQFPLWNPLSYCGQPLLATLQPGIFYPVNLLLILLPFDLGFNWVIILHYFLSGFFVLILLYELRASLSGALAGAITFMLCGYLFSVHNVLSTLLSVTWAPLALFFFLRALRRGSLKYVALTGAVMTVLFTGGGIEVLFATFGLLFLLAVWPNMLDFDSSTTGRGNSGFSLRLRFFLYICLLFLLLSAVQLLPFLELASRSTRSGGLSYFEATTWSFDLKDFLQFFIPDLYGYASSNEKYWANQSWLKTVYTGTMPLLLSLFFFLRYRRKTLLFFFVALLFFMLAMGKNSLIYPYLFDYIPFFSKIRYPVKFLFVPFLFLAVATGLGADSLKYFVQGSEPRKLKMELLLFFITITALLFGALSLYNTEVLNWLVNNGYDYPDYNYAAINLFNTKRLLFFFIISLLGIYSVFSSVRLRRYLPVFLILVLSIDLFFAHNNYYRSTESAEYHKAGEVMKFLQKDDSLFRVFVTPKTLKEGALLPVESSSLNSAESMEMSTERLVKEKLEGYNLEHGIYDISGVNVMKRQRYAELYELIVVGAGVDSTNLLSMMNVKYVLSTPPIDSKDFKLVHVVGVNDTVNPVELKKYEESETLKVYKNLAVLPRFFLVEDFSIIKEKSKRFTRLISKNFSPLSTVLLEENPWKGAAGSVIDTREIPQESSAVKIVKLGANSAELDVTLSVPSILVTSDSWYPGWKVFVDGIERPLLRANHAFKAVALSDGRHKVRFLYSPLSFTIGAIVSGITLTGLIIFFFYNGRIEAYRRRNRV